MRFRLMGFMLLILLTLSACTPINDAVLLTLPVSEDAQEVDSVVVVILEEGLSVLTSLQDAVSSIQSKSIITSSTDIDILVFPIREYQLATDDEMRQGPIDGLGNALQYMFEIDGYLVDDVRLILNTSDLELFEYSIWRVFFTDGMYTDVYCDTAICEPVITFKLYEENGDLATNVGHNLLVDERGYALREE